MDTGGIDLLHGSEEAALQGEHTGLESIRGKGHLGENSGGVCVCVCVCVCVYVCVVCVCMVMDMSHVFVCTCSR